MWRTLSINLVLIALYCGTQSALAETWEGCVGVSNVSGADVDVTIDTYPGWDWKLPASDTAIRYLKADRPVIMSADRSQRPPIHVQPASMVILWNFFLGEHDPENNCANSWRIVVTVAPCTNVADNVCQ